MREKRILKKGDLINDTLKVEFFIGQGMFGEVYRVRHKHLGSQVLKVFKGQYIETADLKTITKEANILSKLTHPNIVRVFESNSFYKNNKQYYFMTMGFVSGETLHQLISRELYLTFDQAFSIQHDFLAGLKEAHRKQPPIIHRDISPDNILISYGSSSPKAMLSDFGLSFSIDRMSQIPGAAGKYIYFAPECFWDVYLPSSDVFSAGIIFYLLLTGKPPWEYEFNNDSDDFEEISTVIIRTRKKLPEKPSVYNENCTEQLDNIVLKALSNDVEDRYKNANEFLIALDNFKSKSYPNQSPDKKNTKENNGKIDLITKGKGKKGFDEIAGMDKLKETLYFDIINPLKDKDLYDKYQVYPPNGMLLYGPPGCGKTFFAQKLAEEVDYNYIELKPSDLASTYMHGTQEKIGQLFNNAKKKPPTIIFIDEIDALLPSRVDSNLNHNFASEVNEFLAQMSDCHKHSIFIIAATNRPERIDPAIMRTGRLDKIIYVGIPDYDARYAMLRLYCKNRPVDSNIDYKKLSEMTGNYVSSDIKYIVNEASRNALKERININQNHFEKVIVETQPSVSQKQINNYEKFRNKRNFD